MDSGENDLKFWRKQVEDIASLGNEKELVVIFGDPQIFFGITTNFVNETEYFTALIPKSLLKIGPFYKFKSNQDLIIGKLYPKHKYKFYGSFESYESFGAVVPSFINHKTFQIKHWLNNKYWCKKDKKNKDLVISKPKGLLFIEHFYENELNQCKIVTLNFHHNDKNELDSLLISIKD